MSAKERIIQFIDFKEFSNRDFCKIIFVSSAYFTKKGAVGSEVLEKIATNFEELNMDWVITGRGEMLIKNRLEGEDLQPIVAALKIENQKFKDEVLELHRDAAKERKLVKKTSVLG